MAVPKQDLSDAIRALRTGAYLPPETGAHLATLLEKHLAMRIGPDAPQGWLNVDTAALDLAHVINSV